ncbi:MAG: FAD-linked oxidase C-terminal domain-containing protein [Actinoallomurus sp.]
MLVLGFESAHSPVGGRPAETVELARSHGGVPKSSRSTVDSWRSAFLRMAYQRDALARMGAIVETFETACTWDRLPGLYEAVRTEIGEVVVSVAAPGLVNCRLTHMYPDGAAPYFTIIAADGTAQNSPLAPRVVSHPLAARSGRLPSARRAVTCASRRP